MIRDVSFAFHIPAASLLKLFLILPHHDLQSLFAHSGLFVKTVSNALRKLFPTIYKRRQFLDGNPDGFKNGIEPLIEKAVAVVNQILLAEKKAIPHIAHISGYLRCPVAVRRMNDAAKPNFTAANVHEKQ